MRILALGAHPDDLEIFAWGTICAWAGMGATLTLAVATDGAAGGDDPGPDLARLRAGEAAAAAAPLGLPPRMLGFPDGRLMPDAALTDTLTALIVETRPDLILTHAPNDYHADHRALSAAVSLAASFRAPVVHMDTLNGTGFTPTLWVDATAHWSAKEAAIRAHASQKPDRFVQMAARQAAFRAGECNAPVDADPPPRAEAFRFDPRFPFADIRALMPPAPPVRPVGAVVPPGI
ncbi:MAG: PIG-L family deacetylase [Rhodobacteraceae bacterium]|jgi:LmbE family N-acetylglucosaminyl deacetylase|nr:PIG-L family deacetylase [Paracoccaceae bacterium]